MHDKKAVTLLALGFSLLLWSSPAKAETLQYDWKLRGALSWVARLKFPTRGIGVLHTGDADRGTVHSELRVNAGGRDYLEYSTRMEESARRTLQSANGYSFGSRSERKETVYDYAGNFARVVEREEGVTDTTTRPLPVEEARDILTTIAFLRERGRSITAPMTTSIYADGKPYRVRIEPGGFETMEWSGRSVSTRLFRVVAAAGEKKKFPGLSVWLTEDDRRLPIRIVLEQSFATLDLRLRS